MNNLSLKKVSIITAIIYTALIAVSMYTAFHINGTSYDKPEMVNTLIWFEIIMTLFAVVMSVKFFSYHQLGFTKINKKNMVWLLPMAVVSVMILFNMASLITQAQITTQQWQLFAIVGITTLLIGVSEELVYRGVVFAAFFKDSKVKALLVSAMMFSLLHSVNVLAGVDLTGMVIQMAMTFITGLFYGLVRLKIQCIIPLMIFHWLWDFYLIGGTVLQVADVNSFFITGFMLFELAVVCFYLPYYIYQLKKASH